jgi:hypothetical protein
MWVYKKVIPIITSCLFKETRVSAPTGAVLLQAEVEIPRMHASNPWCICHTFFRLNARLSNAQMVRLEIGIVA